MEAWLLRAVESARRAAQETSPGEPLKGAMVRATPAPDAPADAAALLAWWQSRTPGTVRSEARYRWELGHRIGVPSPAYAGPVAAWSSWRRGDQQRLEREPFGLEAALLLPIVLTENLELLLELAAAPEGACPASARALLSEAAPIMRRDFARFVQMADPWEDTFALWCLTRRPRALALLHPIAVAIAACYAAGASSPLCGLRFPYHEVPLVSACAHLAASLLTLGADVDLAADLAEYVRAARRADGGWGDGDDPSDVLTTLACAELLARIDPSFEPLGAVAFLRERQGDDGLWRALGPDAPWLTNEIVTWVVSTEQPFANRFRWPHRADATCDHKTGLPFFAHFADIASLFETLPALAEAMVEVAFIDLIGFRAFNNQFGQSAGDDVLRELALELETIPATRSIRDGGDEFLVVGAPTLAGLHDTMDAFRKSWPRRFRRVFGADVPPVAPRILLGRTQGRQLRAARETLGRGITALKNDPSAHPYEGLLVDGGAL